MNLEIYKEKLAVFHQGWAGKEKKEMFVGELPQSPIIEEFLKDDEIQYLSIASSNLGISWEIEKQYKKV